MMATPQVATVALLVSTTPLRMTTPMPRNTPSKARLMQRD
jgi:hypothetical protein